MDLQVIDNPGFQAFTRRSSGFRNSEFKMLAGLYSRAASVRALYDMAVDVDFDEGVCKITYFKSNNYRPSFQFVIRRVGPFTDMYEVYQEGRGRIVRSGLFRRAYERLEDEILSLMPKPD